MPRRTSTLLQNHDVGARACARNRHRSADRARLNRLGLAPALGLCAWPISSIASVGTSVRDRMYEASIANTTASASGTNRITRHAGQEEHRHEHDTDTQRRDERRHRDFAGAVENRLVQIRAHMQVPLDVLDRHRRIVDQNPDRQRKAAQRHDVDGLPERVQRDQRGQDRQRNRNRDDAGAAPVAEEQQDHRSGQCGGDQRFAHHALHRRLHEHRLVEQRRDLEVRRQRGARVGQQGMQRIDDRRASTHCRS